MPDDDETTASASRRRPRIPAAVARRRMLDAGIALVERDGLTVGFDHLPLEEIIAEAGVSRASAYRQWGSHEAYVADLVTEVFSRPGFSIGLSPATTEATTVAMREHVDRLATREGRHAVLLELIRIAGERNFRDLLASKPWQAYESLYAAAASPGDASTAQTLQTVARELERRVIDTNLGFYQGLLGLLSMRARAPHTLRMGAAATHAVVSGLAHRIRIEPALADVMVDGPSIDGGTTPWHIAAHLSRCTIEPFLEHLPEGDADAAPLRVV